MYKLAISPVQNNYSTNNIGAKSIIYDGPKSLYAKEKELNVIMVTVSWVVNGLGFQYLRSFYRGGTTCGAEPFLIDLILDTGAVTEYTAMFTPGTFALTNKNGNIFTVSAQLDVMPIINTDMDNYHLMLYYLNSITGSDNATYLYLQELSDMMNLNYLIMNFENLYGDKSQEVVDLFSTIVNANWPEV